MGLKLSTNYALGRLKQQGIDHNKTPQSAGLPPESHLIAEAHIKLFGQ